MVEPPKLTTDVAHHLVLLRGFPQEPFWGSGLGMWDSWVLIEGLVAIRSLKKGIIGSFSSNSPKTSNI